MMNGSTTSQGQANGRQVRSVDLPGPSIPNNGPRHCPLTPMRRCRGVLCLVIMLLTAFMMMVYLSPVTTFLIRLFSVHYSRKSTCFLFGMWLAMWPFLFEKINKTRFVFSGENVPPKECVLLFANHRTEVDWMYLWDLALRKGRLQCIKYILKKSLMKLPVFSWAFHIIEFIPVERKWEIDEPLIRSRLSELKNPKDPLWLAVFPEGTDYTEKKCIKSQEYAAEHGLPILKNVLLPKTKGFNCCLQELRSSLDAVYDITIAYKHRLPSFLDNVYGIDPSEVHIHTEIIQVSDIPTSEDEVADWLIERFRLKDKLLSDFSTQGHFPVEGTERDLSTPKCLANFVAVPPPPTGPGKKVNLFDIDGTGTLAMSAFEASVLDIWVIDDYESGRWAYRAHVKLPRVPRTPLVALAGVGSGDAVLLASTNRVRVALFDVKRKTAARGVSLGGCRGVAAGPRLFREGLVLHAFFEPPPCPGWPLLDAALPYEEKGEGMMLCRGIFDRHRDH